MATGDALEHHGDRVLVGEPDEPRVVDLARNVDLRRAGLAGEVDALERGRRARRPAPPFPAPSLTTFFITSVSLRAASGDMTRAARLLSISSWVRPSGSTIFCVMCGSIRTPPLATVAATVAIWSGVTRSLSWPIAIRPTSMRREVGPSSLPRLRSPDASSWFAGRSIGGGL